MTRADATEAKEYLPPVAAVLFILVLLAPSPLARAAPPGPLPLSSAAYQRRSPVAGFEAADRVRQRMYRELDVTLGRWAFTPGGPALATVSSEIDAIRRAGVRDLTTFKGSELELLASGEVTARVRQNVVVSPRFIDGEGADVTVGTAQAQVIIWDLRWTSSGWLIHAGRVVESSAP